MTALALNPGSSATAARGLLLTGARRTGTSPMAMLLYSTNEIELAFEPPALRALLPLIGKIADEHWRYLLHSYLFEEFLIGTLAGRVMNQNRNDDSSVFNALGEEEVSSRLGRGHRQIELAPRAAGRTVAYKLPDMTPYIDSLRQVEPLQKIVVMLRHPNAILHSVQRMGWFSDERLKGISADWPHRSTDGVPAPHWVEDDVLDQWRRWSPLERCYYYYCRMYAPVAARTDVIVVSLESFVRNSMAVFSRLSEQLGLTKGPLTDKLLSGVYDPNTKYETSLDIPKPWDKRMAELYEACASKALKA